MAILSFLGNTFIAYRILDEGDYPGANLYEIEASLDPPKPEGSTNVRELNKLQGVFQATKEGTLGTAFIQSTELGEWGPVKFVDQQWMEDVVIPMPNDKYMEPEEAHKKMVAKGYDGPFHNMTFRYPLYYTVNEAEYIFGMADGVYVIVGAISGYVETERPSDFKLKGLLKTDA